MPQEDKIDTSTIDTEILKKLATRHSINPHILLCNVQNGIKQ